tara:strand:+ start:958 stop:1884 length:927 start_codon:yes stop_codon:yes gene_type:complete
MATTTSITTTYAGEFAGKYISAALLSASTIENGGVEVMPNIKFKQVIQKLEIDGIVKDATCDFDATSTLTMTERVLQVEDFQVNLQICKKDFHSTWQSMEMGMSSFDNLPSSFQDYLIGHVAAKVAQKQEQNLWRGVNATAGEYDGLVTLATADATVIDVVAGAVTSANVIAELGKIVDAIPSALYGKEDLKIYVAQNIARAYVRALGGFAAAGLGANGSDNKGTQWFNNGALSFDGVNVFVAQGLADNTAMAAESSNLFFGTSLLSDAQEVKVLDMTDLDGSDNVRVIMKFAAGAQYGIGSDIVLYS